MTTHMTVVVKSENIADRICRVTVMLKIPQMAMVT